MAGTPSEAPSSKVAPPGSGTACRAGSAVHSAAVPHAAAGRGQPQPDPLADTARVHPGADRLDDPRAVLVRDLEAVDGPRDSPGPGLMVGGVDAGGVHPDQDLARARRGPVHLLDPEDLGRMPHVPVQCCSHACRLAPLRTLSTALRGPCTARPAKLSSAAGTARTRRGCRRRCRFRTCPWCRSPSACPGPALAGAPAPTGPRPVPSVRPGLSKIANHGTAGSRQDGTAGFGRRARHLAARRGLGQRVRGRRAWTCCGRRSSPGSPSSTPPTSTATGAVSASSAGSWPATPGQGVTVATKMGRRVEQKPENYTLENFRAWTDRSRVNLGVGHARPGPAALPADRGVRHGRRLRRARHAGRRGADRGLRRERRDVRRRR